MARYVCRNCLYLGKPERELRGSGALELVLLLLGVLPGIIYGIWRHGGQTFLCPRCRRPVIDPEAQAVLASLRSMPPEGLSPLERASRVFKALPMAGGVTIVVLFLVVLAFPSLEGRKWILWVVYAAGIAILAHPVWLVVHLALRAADRPRE
jgi:hypothetical protein